MAKALQLLATQTLFGQSLIKREKYLHAQTSSKVFPPFELLPSKHSASTKVVKMHKKIAGGNST